MTNTKNTIKIIGIAGKAGSGKDTLAKFLVEEMIARHGPASRSRRILYPPIFHFADTVKHIVKVIFNLTENDVQTEEGKQSRPPQCYGFSIRELLVKVGTEMFRDMINENIWADNLKLRIHRHIAEILHDHESIDYLHNFEGIDFVYVIPDVRFDSEVKTIKDLGGVVIGIERGDRSTTADPEHRSEAGLDKILAQDCSAIVTNNEGLDELKIQANGLLDLGIINPSTAFDGQFLEANPK